jgi:hypothetical protein
MIHFDRQIVVGIVLDISIQHRNGSRHIDIVKSGLVDFSTKLGLNCGIYVAHPNKHEMPRQQGESVAGIFSYSEPLGFRPADAFLQATEMIAAQEADEKYVVLITDRFRPSNQYLKPLSLNESRKYGCKFLFLGIGDTYDRSDLNKFKEHKDCSVYHFDDPAQVAQKITETIIIGV